MRRFACRPDAPSPLRPMFVASTGGHLEQLVRLAPRLAPSWENGVWVTFDSPQSRSLLAGYERYFIEDIPSREWRGALRAVATFKKLVRETGVDGAFSTGAAIAVPALTVASVRGLPATYIESVARAEGPSVAGRILAANPRIDTRTQYRGLRSERWREAPSVFDGFRVEEVQPRNVQTVLVMLGTIKFPFKRLVEKLRQLTNDGVQIVWQTGATGDAGCDIEFIEIVARDEVNELIDRADAVVCHAGVGSALSVLARGKTPVLVPRRASRGEHVDDHQVQIARELSLRGLATHVEVDELRPEHLRRAASRRVISDI